MACREYRIAMPSDPQIESLQVAVYTFPTATPESDGTIEWDKTSLVLVPISSGGVQGMGYSYADVATAKLIEDTLAPKLLGHDAMATGAAWRRMADLIRNLGRPGIASMAIAAVDNTLWDLKGKLLNVSVAALLGLAPKNNGLWQRRIHFLLGCAAARTTWRMGGVWPACGQNEDRA